jgi:glutathione S-transferase
MRDAKVVTVFFLAAGFLFVLTDPSLLLARVLLYGYVGTRLLHFIAYVTARTHDTRALFWTPGSLIIVVMGGRTLLAARGAL